MHGGGGGRGGGWEGSLMGNVVDKRTSFSLNTMVLSLPCVAGQCEAGFQTDGECRDTSEESQA